MYSAYCNTPKKGSKYRAYYYIHHVMSEVMYSTKSTYQSPAQPQTIQPNNHHWS